MATIGYIAIGMGVNLGGLSKGLGGAKGMVGGFAASIGGPAVAGLVAFTAGAGAASAAVDKLVQGLEATARLASDFEDQMNLASRTLGIGLGPEMSRISDEILELSTSADMAGIKLEDLGAIAVMGGRMGESTGSIVDFTRSIAMVKISLDDIPVEEAAQGLTQLNAAFGLGSDKIQNTASALNILSNNAKTTGREILDVGNRLKQNASLLKFSVTETLAVSTALLDAGVSAEVAGTNMGLFLAKMAKDVRGFARTAGVSVQEFERILDSNPMEALSMFLSGLSESRQDIALLEGLGITGARESGVVISLKKAGEGLHEFARMAKEDFETLASLLLDNTTSTQRHNAQVQHAWNRINAEGIKLGAEVLPIIAKGMEIAADAVSSVDWSPMIEGLRATGEGMKTLGEATEGITTVVGTLAGPTLAVLVYQIRATSKVIEAAAAPVVALAQAVKLLGRGKEAPETLADVAKEAGNAADAVEKMKDAAGGGGWLDEQVGGFAERLREEIRDFGTTDLEREWNRLVREGAAPGQLGEVEALYAQLEALKAQEEQLREMERAHQDLESQAARVFDETRTPLERFEAQLENLKGLLAEGLIDEDTFRRAEEMARDILDRGGDDGLRMAGAMELGSREALAAVARHRGSGGEDSGREQVRIAREQLDEQRQTRGAIRRLPAEIRAAVAPPAVAFGG